MKKLPQVFVVSQQWYLEPFKDLMERTTDLKRADVALFTGGEDVSPVMYSESTGSRTFSNPTRDRYEAAIFDRCEEMGIKKLGICRGSQFLTVMSGGKLAQDVTNHTRPHEVHLKGGDVVFLSSTHHQMMIPFGTEHELIGWAEGLSDHYWNGENKEIAEVKRRGVEPEIVFYPRTNALCIQAHPEIMDPRARGVEVCRNLVREYLLK